MMNVKLFARLGKKESKMPNIPDGFRDQFKDIDQNVVLKLVLGITP